MSSQSDYQERKQAKVAQIEQILAKYLPEPTGEQQVIMEAMAYNLMAGGKRLRPLLMQETFRLFQGTSKAIEPFMAAIEMIHTYSLIHDDLPAMDDDALRRGRKTTHVVYGEAIGVLTGDALLNYAFETAATAFDLDPAHADRIGRAFQILANKAGIYGMIGGQVIDVSQPETGLSPKELDTMYALKTGALIQAAMMVGAVLSGAGEDEVVTVSDMAGAIGLAFQIQDDILDVTGDDQTLGKPVHSDEKNQKTTYVTQYGVTEAARMVSEKTQEALALLSSLPGDDSFLRELFLDLVHRDR